MINVSIKKYSKLFAQEINKDKVVTDLIGQVDPKDIYILHQAFRRFFFETIYSAPATVIKFGKWFSFSSRPHSVFKRYKVETIEKSIKNRSLQSNSVT